MNQEKILKGYEYAKEVYAGYGINVDAAIERIDKIPVSMHCWQGDDVIGFDGAGALSGGIQATGNYPGRARTPEELMSDMDKALSLIPGTHRTFLKEVRALKMPNIPLNIMTGITIRRQSLQMLNLHAHGYSKLIKTDM